MNAWTLSRGARRVRACLALFLLGAGVVGCFNPFSPRISRIRGISTPAPAPTTPQNALRLFEWCYNNRRIEEYRELIAADYRFQFAQTDSAGNAYRDRPFTRTDDIESTEHMFLGGSEEPPADRITLEFDPNLIPFPDSRAGKHARWHKEIRTTVTLRVTTPSVQYEVQGNARFFLVRGDSAVVPEELRARFEGDSTRWWLERWEDETIQTLVTGDAKATSVGRALPSRPASIGQLKALYRPRRPTL